MPGRICETQELVERFSLFGGVKQPGILVSEGADSCEPHLQEPWLPAYCCQIHHDHHHKRSLLFVYLARIRLCACGSVGPELHQDVRKGENRTPSPSATQGHCTRHRCVPFHPEQRSRYYPCCISTARHFRKNPEVQSSLKKQRMRKSGYYDLDVTHLDGSTLHASSPEDGKLLPMTVISGLNNLCIFPCFPDQPLYKLSEQFLSLHFEQYICMEQKNGADGGQHVSFGIFPALWSKGIVLVCLKASLSFRRS